MPPPEPPTLASPEPAPPEPVPPSEPPPEPVAEPDELALAPVPAASDDPDAVPDPAPEPDDAPEDVIPPLPGVVVALEEPGPVFPPPPPPELEPPVSPAGELAGDEPPEQAIGPRSINNGSNEIRRRVVAMDCPRLAKCSMRGRLHVGDESVFLITRSVEGKVIQIRLSVFGPVLLAGCSLTSTLNRWPPRHRLRTRSCSRDGVVNANAARRSQRSG